MSSGNDAAVEVCGLKMHFGSVTAVDGASFRVGAGEVYALLGRNGSGKSTTVRCLLGQLKATSGNLRLFGLDSWRQRREIMLRVGVAPEAPDIPSGMTPAQVSRFVAPLYPTWDSAAFDERLRHFGVPMNRPFSSLSKGQCKSVCLALALSSAPELVILDDPTLGLDAVARKGLYDELIGELAERNTTVLITTHDLSGIEGVADHVGVMHEGRIVLDGELASIKGRFRRLRFPLAAAQDIDAMCSGDDVVCTGVVGGRAEIVVSKPGGDSERRCREHAGDRVSCESMSLEEIFIALCGREIGERS